jgi:hypothetical protein
MEPEGSLQYSQEPATYPHPMSDQSSPYPNPTSWRSILILSSPLCEGFSSLSASGVPPRTYLPHVLHALSIYFVFIWSLTVTSSFLGPNIRIFLITLFSNTFSLYSSFPQCERPSFTSMQNNVQNYSYVYLNFYIFGHKTGRQNSLHRIIASIPWLQSALNFFVNGILMLRIAPTFLSIC